MESMLEQKNQEIEILAFEIFQEKLGLRFKSNLTFEEKKKITDIPAYQQYRDEALKVYNQRQAKKERAVFNKKYPVIKVEASGKPCGKRSGTSGESGIYNLDKCRTGSELVGFGDTGSAARFFKACGEFGE